MKKILTLIFIIALVGCDESNEKVEPFKDITGTWAFNGEIFSGTFKIVKTLDGKFSIEPPTSFKINSKSYTSADSREVTVDGLKTHIELYGSDDGFIVLSDVLYKSDFTEMTSSSQSYAENCLANHSCPHISTAFNIKITRK